MKLSLLFFLVVVLASCSSDPEKQLAVIESINPASGKYGTEVTLTGTNFDPSVTPFKVMFSGTQADIVQSDGQKIIVKVPKGAKTGKVTLETDLGVVEGPEFEYVYTVTVSTIAGSIFGFADGAAMSAKFYSPVSVVTDQEGNVLVADRNGSRIRKISPSGQVSTFAGTGVKGSLDGDITTAQFSSPNYMAYDAQGNLFVAELIGRIRKITPSGQVSVFAGGESQGYADGVGVEAQFNSPMAMVFDSKGNMFVSDFGNGRIRKITPDGTVSTVAGNGTLASVDGTGLSAQLNQPWGITIDKSDNLFVAEWEGSRVRKITPGGEVTTVAGGAVGFQDGEATAARFGTLYGISIDNDQNLYVADGYRLRMIVNFKKVITLAGDGQPGLNDGDGAGARFNFVCGITIGADKSIIIADRNNVKIRKVLLE